MATTVPSTQLFSAAMVLKRHPDYDAKLKHWQFVEATYHGGREWFQNNIFKYMKEGDKEFADRLNRAYRFNHTREVVDLVSKYIMRGEIQRDSAAPEEVKRFWRKATKNGATVSDFMTEVSRMSSVFGMPWVVVDQTRPSDGKTVITRADERDADIYPYAYLVKPQDVLDMSLDDRGELNWILIRDTDRDDSDWQATTFITYDVWRVWTRTHWYKLTAETIRGKRLGTIKDPKTDKIRLVDSGRHDLGRVPVLPISDRGGSNGYTAPGLIDDIAYLDRAVANYLSNLDAIIQDQTFSQLVIPEQGIRPGDEGYDKLIELGTKRIFTYDAEGSTRGPEYIAPDPKQAQIILAVITKIITEIYHSAGVAGERTKMDNAVGIDNSSGVAKAYDFDRINAMLAAKADRLEKLENDMAALVQLWRGKEPVEPEQPLIKYPEEFDTLGLRDEFDIAQQMFAINAPVEVRRHQMKKMVDKLYPQLDADLKAKIQKDIDGWPENTMPDLGLEESGPSSGSEPSRQGQVTADTP